MLFKFPKVKITDEVFDYIKESYISSIVTYIINSKYRKSVSLKNWLKEQCDKAVDDPFILDIVDKQIPDCNSYDEQVLSCLNWVRNNIVYKGDLKSWEMAEYWQTYRETLDKMSGDCEDGAILLYVLCRLKGVPANRLLLFAGDVVGGGHCWIGYKPESYPLNFVFLDWCYWVNLRSVEDRNKFYIKIAEIFEYRQDRDFYYNVDSNYKTIWFAFSEDSSYWRLNFVGREGG
jgi:hypothetical protein